jgi:aminoglycoside phosphotransferase family enzyme
MSKERDGQVVREVHISTVFLGLDHSFDEGRPLLFETMTFGGQEHDQRICERCTTWDEAVAQHERVKNYIMGKTKSL